MARILKPIGKMSRREGVALDDNPKNAARRRPGGPGQHGAVQARPKRSSGYGIQLREKQKAKRQYGILERQFRNYFEKATRKKGNTSEYLVQALEMRLDNVIYRLGFGLSRRHARQLVNHGFFMVNGKKVDIPSYHTGVGDTVTIKENKRQKPVFSTLSERLAKQKTPSWLHVDPASTTGKVTSIPAGEDLKQIFDPTLIVEFYSR
ncbi:30S ribosomal protein S4 [Candidatus Uhrbacteria bacterium]|nr:30S ribosomal protein S4 [Candidatus Uhrbacteria bacterium]